ncbi:MAG: dihydropteroate synthase [Synergistaceae bacterium]|nr:dihydropteroate synthase [Synergistaceae bacterium]
MLLIIGESLNGSIPAVGKAILNRDEAFIKSLALEQESCGANYLDVNAGGVGGHNSETDDLIWLVGVVQKAVNIPLVIDSSSPAALKEAIKTYTGPRPILSSATGEKHSADTLIPLALEYDCPLVALCMDEKGIPGSVDGRLEAAEYFVEYAISAGMKAQNIYIDPLVMAVSADLNAGSILIQTLKKIKEIYPDISTICAPSNVSYGMPNRRLLNRSFISILISSGISGFIIDVRDRRAFSTILASEVIMGQDLHCKSYLNSYRNGLLEK